MSEQIRLGDLLTRAGLLRPEDLREGMLIAKQQSLPVGRVLIMAEFISEPDLQAAVQAQSMLKDGVIDIDTALAALQKSAENDISLDDALSQIGWKDKTDSLTNKLGGLLLEAGTITKEQLDQGLLQCQMSGLPLGRVLVGFGVISEQLLSAALNAQILIRDSKIQRDQATQGLRACHERQISIEQSLKDAGLQIPTQDTVRLGEVLVMANLLNQDNLMQAIELGLTQSKPIGQIFVEYKMVTQQVLDAALEVQRMVGEGKVKKETCGEVLALMQKKGISLDEAVKELEPPKPPPVPALPLYQFLQLAGLITAKDIEEALKQGSRDTELMGRMLLLTGALNESVLNSAVRLNDMVTQGVLKAEQAILAMGLCQSRQCSIEQAFKSLGWSFALDPSLGQETIPPSQVLSNPLTSLTEGGGAQVVTPQVSQGVNASGAYNAVQPSQADLIASGQFAAVQQTESSGQYPALPQQQQDASGQYAALQQTNNSGQYSAVQQPTTASGQYESVQQQTTSGQHASLEGFDDMPNSQTATSDVPVIDASSMLLASPEAFEEKTDDSSDQMEAAQAVDDEETGGGGKGKKKGKKRLADLMP